MPHTAVVAKTAGSSSILALSITLALLAFPLPAPAADFSLKLEPGVSVLDAVAGAGVVVLSSCRVGTCGTCETPVLEGPVEHRDSVLTPAEQGEDTAMMICVSRAAGPRLVLDL